MIYDQISIQSELQEYFDAGASDIYEFDKTAKENIIGVKCIVNGAMKKGLKVMAINSSDSELTRITGFLVKKSDISKIKEGIDLREDTVSICHRCIENLGILNRKRINID